MRAFPIFLVDPRDPQDHSRRHPPEQCDQRYEPTAEEQHLYNQVRIRPRHRARQQRDGVHRGADGSS